MIAQKQTYIPTVSSVQVQNWPAETTFSSDIIEFKDSHKDWSISIFFDGDPTGATLSLEVANDLVNGFNNYKTLSTNIDLTNSSNYSIFDDIMPFRYMKLRYVSGSATGFISIKMSI
jgi:hypothetical protein